MQGRNAQTGAERAATTQHQTRRADEHAVQAGVIGPPGALPRHGGARRGLARVVGHRREVVQRVAVARHCHRRQRRRPNMLLEGLTRLGDLRAQRILSLIHI